MGGQAPRRVPARIRDQICAVGRREVEIRQRVGGCQSCSANEDHVLGGVDAPLPALTHKSEGTRHGCPIRTSENARRVDAGDSQDGDVHLRLRGYFRSCVHRRRCVRVVHEDLGFRLPVARGRGCEEQTGRRVVVLCARGARPQEVSNQSRGVGAIHGSFGGELNAGAVARGHIEGGRSRGSRQGCAAREGQRGAGDQSECASHSSSHSVRGHVAISSPGCLGSVMRNEAPFPGSPYAWRRPP